MLRPVVAVDFWIWQVLGPVLQLVFTGSLNSVWRASTVLQLHMQYKMLKGVGDVKVQEKLKKEEDNLLDSFLILPWWQLPTWDNNGNKEGPSDPGAFAKNWT